MLGLLTAAAVELITVHMIDGRIVQINPKQVVQLLSAHATGNKALVDAVNCVVRFTDGTFLSVIETCDAVRDLMAQP